MGNRRADFLLWIGSDAIYTWDRRTGNEGCIRFSSAQRIPYVPGFHEIWEDSERYQQELQEMLGLRRFRLFGKRRILMAAPEDLTQIEQIALEDFIYAAVGGSLKRRRGLQLISQSELLPPPAGRYIAVTHSCRCYCVAVVEEGRVAKKELLDVNDCSREVLLRQIRDFHSSYHDNTMEVCYPQMEVNLLLDRLGAELRLADIGKAHLA